MGIELGFSMVFDTHIFIGSLHPHLGKLCPLEIPIDELLLPTMFSNPKKMKIEKNLNAKDEGLNG